MTVCRAARRGGDRGDGDGRGRKHEQGRHHLRLVGAEPLRPVAEAAGDEGQAQHEQRVRQDRPDERRPNDVEQAGAQGEDADEELGQVAQGRLHDPGCLGPEAVGELLRAFADQRRQAGQPDCRGAEDGHSGGPAETQEERRKAGADRHRDDDPGPSLEVPQHASASRADCARDGPAAWGDPTNRRFANPSVRRAATERWACSGRGGA